MVGNWKESRVGLIALAVLTLSQVSCSADMTGGYMLSASDGLIYLRITQINNKLTGYMQTVEALDLRSTAGFVTKQSPLSGEVSGASFSLGHTVEAILSGGMGPCEGSRKSGKLVLQFPSGDGRTITDIFRPVSTSAWNGAVASFKLKRSAAAYMQKWSDVLWNRQRELCNDFSDAHSTLNKATAELQEHKTQAEAARARVKQANQAIANANELLAEAQVPLSTTSKKLKTAMDESENRHDSGEAMDTACVALSSACAASAGTYHKLAAGCSLSGVKDNLQSAESNFHSAEANVRSARSEIGRSRGEGSPNDADNDLRDAQNDLRDAANDLRDVENNLHDVENDIRDLENGLHDAEHCLSDAQASVDKNQADINSASQKIAEDTNDLDYLAPRAVGLLLDSFRNGIPVGTVIAATTINDRPSSTSKPLYGVELHRQLPVLSVPQYSWSPVSLPNSKIGWIPAKNIRVSYSAIGSQAKEHKAVKQKRATRKRKK